VPYRSAPQCRRLVLDSQADLQTVVSDRWLWRNRIAVLMTGSARRLRCAIYTRKSSEHNLDLAFTSLDAQREACEAYIKSQASEGWLVSDHYNDGGLSGASLERPALQALLADVRAGKIDIVLVYKVDRLTRSLADFAKLIELFDTHSVSFLSVTQSFNTGSSMGRLTLNVLLSFAQFERELIGERVRDKIAASKRKGIWVGGPVPLGYAAVDKKILVVEVEAQAVRTIFTRYLEFGSIRALAEDLDRRGIRSKPRRLSNGRTVGGGRFGVGALAYLLKNRFYIGEVVYRGEVHGGEQAPIVDRALFEAVQAKLAAQTRARRCRLRGSPALLTGRIFDDRGNRMSPTHANKSGFRYRYYASQAVLQNKPRPSGLVGRVPGAEIEALVVAALRSHLTASSAGEQLPNNDRDLLERHLERVTLTPNHLELRLRELIEPRQADHPANDGSSGPPIANVTTIAVPWSSPVPATVKGIIHVPAHNTPIKAGRREALLIAIVKARQWIDDLAHGRAASFVVIARREGKAERHISLLAPLAFVSPRIVSALLEGTAPADLTVTKLARALPYCWAEQERRVGTSAPFHYQFRRIAGDVHCTRSSASRAP
jgi:site-specific DNA recombinase